MDYKRVGIFLDRDGTLIHHIPYLHDPAKVSLVVGVADKLKALKQLGVHLFLFTNQSGVGRGMFTMKEVDAVNAKLSELLNLETPFTRSCIAPEHPDEEPIYRKPEPRFILECIEAYDLDPSYCWMLGDSEVDRLAAKNSGIQFQGISKTNPDTAEKLELILKQLQKH